jgi:hypothetical protein
MNRNSSSFTRPINLVFREMLRVFIVERYTLILLFALFLVFLILGLFFDRDRLPGSQISDFFSNFSVDILGGIIIFVILDRSIKHLSPIGEQQTLPVQDFINDLRNSTRYNAKILDTWTYLLNEKKYREDFIPSLRQALKNGVRIQVLIIDPKSEAALQRAEELKRSTPPVDVIEEVKRCIAYWQHVRNAINMETGDLSLRLEVKIYDANPGITYYSHDNLSYIGFFPVHNRADLSPQLEVPLSTSLGILASRRFAELWDHAQIIDAYLADPQNLDLAKYIRHFITAIPT